MLQKIIAKKAYEHQISVSRLHAREIKNDPTHGLRILYKPAVEIERLTPQMCTDRYAIEFKTHKNFPSPIKAF